MQRAFDEHTPTLALRYVPGTNLAYLLVRDEEDHPEVVEIGQAYVTPADRARSAAMHAGWTHMMHTVRVRLADGSQATVEFFRGEL